MDTAVKMVCRKCHNKAACIAVMPEAVAATVSAVPCLRGTFQLKADFKFAGVIELKQKQKQKQKEDKNEIQSIRQ